MTTEAQMREQLAPCPICKATPEQHFNPETDFGTWDTHIVACEQPNDHIVVVMAVTKEEAVSKWQAAHQSATEQMKPLVDFVRILASMQEKFVDENGRLLCRFTPIALEAQQALATIEQGGK